MIPWQRSPERVLLAVTGLEIPSMALKGTLCSPSVGNGTKTRRSGRSTPQRGIGAAVARGLRALVRASAVMACLSCLAAKPALSQADASGDGVLSGHGGAVRSMAVLADGRRLISGGFDSAVIMWALDINAAQRVFRHHDSAVNALAALDAGCFASGGEDGRIALWCGDDAQPHRVLSGHSAPISSLLHLRGRQLLASASWDRSIRLWRLSDGLAQGVIAGHDGPVTGLAHLADGALVSTSYDGQLRVTPARGPGRMLRLDAPLNAVAITRDDIIVTAGADGKVRLFAADLQALGERDLGNGPLNALAVSPDGAVIAAAGIRTQVTLIRRQTLEVTGDILGPGLPVWSLAFSPDGSELFSGGADRAVRRWNPLTAKPAGREIASAAPPERIAESEEGARVFRACRACHGLTAGDNSRAGPSLHGIMGRKIASAAGYAYSQALKQRDIVWSKETISKLFEIGPNAYLPGTKMPEQTIPDAQARQALVDWLDKITR